MAKTLHLDLESRSDIDLPAAGLAVYSKGRHTDLICAAYAFDEGPVYLWTPDRPCPPNVYTHIESGGEIVAHNAAFEREMINNVGARKYGWPHIYADQTVCTMAMAYAMALPGSLDNAAAALGSDQQKDPIGKRIMLQYSAPKDILPNGQIVWWDDPVKLQQIYEYCKQDVVVEREIGKRMFRLSDYEKQIFVLDQKINERGIQVDVKAVLAAMEIVEGEKVRLNEAMNRASQNEIASCNAVAQIKKYVSKRIGQDVESLAKGDLIELLEKRDLPEDCKIVLNLRKEAGKASAAKLDAIVAGVSSDNRIRGTFQYSGANTRRWTGRRIQLQNLKRPDLKPEVVEEIAEKLPNGLTSEHIDILYGSPIDVISNCIRGFLISAPNHDLIACDFNAIEARVLAWLAGQQNVIEIFNTHGKIYEHAAAQIFQKTMEQINQDQRQVGKVAVLALGYGGGVGALQKMARGYGVALAPSFSGLWALASPDTRQWLEKVYLQNKSKNPDISREEYLSSDLTKTFWRKDNPAIVQFWADLESAAISSVLNPGKKFEVGGPARGLISYLTKGSFLFCRLPSGGVLSYPYPKVESIKTPWGEKKEGLTYKFEDKFKWVRGPTYGGSLCENVTQAVARDLLADAMLRLEKKGYPIVLHAHDEAVCEMRKGEGSIDEMASVMCDLPLWAKGLPVRASGWRGTRYRK